jgi:hypothetical protein
MVMKRVDGTSARQLDLLDEPGVALPKPAGQPRPRPTLQLLRRDIYAELARRRRRAQIAARKALGE